MSHFLSEVLKILKECQIIEGGEKMISIEKMLIRLLDKKWIFLLEFCVFIFAWDIYLKIGVIIFSMFFFETSFEKY